MFSYTHPTLPRTTSEQIWGPAAVFGLFPCDDRLFWWASEVRPEGGVDPPTGRKSDVLQTYRGWPESIPEVIEATPEGQIYRGDLYHRLPIKEWSKGRVTLLGDAAHPTMPAFGQGAGMAMEDAAVLTRELGAAGGLTDRAGGCRCAAGLRGAAHPPHGNDRQPREHDGKRMHLEAASVDGRPRSAGFRGATEGVATNLRARAHLPALRSASA